MNILYTVHIKATGGRNGHMQIEDGQVPHDLSVPKAMDGPGKPNIAMPEDLFVAGYAARFGSTCNFVARSILRLNPSNIEVHYDVGIGTREEDGSGLKVGLTARISNLSQADAEELMAQARQVCPYSDAMRNNVEVTLKTEVV